MRTMAYDIGTVTRAFMDVHERPPGGSGPTDPEDSRRVALDSAGAGTDYDVDCQSRL